VTANGVVREWAADEGWGVIDSPETPGGCWAHFGALHDAGLVALTTGQHVTFDFVRVEQDGFHYRASRVWPEGQAARRPSDEASLPSSAYSSRLTITHDDATERSTSRSGPRGTLEN